jgi:hypothetical protein
MSTFRKYGGTQNYSKDNNITTNTLVCNNLVLRNDYVGTFTIDGGLEVSADSHFGQNVDISGNLTAQNVQINSGFVFSDLSINGNLEVFQNTTIEGYLNVYDALYFGQGANSYLFGNQTQELLGLNTTDPQATLDIQGSTTNVLNVYSNQPTNRNIIAQNQNNHGIVVQTSDISSSIQFFNDTTISNTTPDAQIEYLEGGYLILDASNTQVYSQFSIVPSTDSSLGYIKNETAIIYDISSGKYLPKIYNTQTTENTGNALTLVTTDTSSITFLNIITPLQKGLEIGGGVYPNDTSRSLGTLGYNDNSGNYIPFQNMVSGSSLVKLRATTGLNTYAPRTDLYTLDINGPVHITNGQITPVIDSSFQILQTHFSNTTGISVGTPSSITSPYYQNILYTNNGGQSWNLSNINSGDLQTLSQNFNTIYTYNSTYAFLGGTSGFFYYTNNGGQSWANITIANLTTIYSIYVCASPSVSGLRVYYLTNTGLGAIITYFDVLFTNLNGNQYLPVTIFPINDSAFTQVTHINGDGTTYIYVTGINTSGKDQIARYPLNISSATYTTPNALYNYNAINVLNNIVIAVGTGSIYCSTNASTSYTWTNNTSISATLTSIYILDSLNAVAVGTNGTIIYSNNGFITWQNIPTEILNASGNATDITSYNLVDIDMIDINTLIITATITSYVNGSQLGNSREFYLYLPNLFNRQNNSVLDISGATYISGDLHVNDGGGIVSNDVSFSLINTNVQTIYFGGTATSINIGSTTGNTTIQNNLVVLGETITQDISLNGNIYVNNDININNGVTGQQGYDIAIGINAGQIGQQSGSIAIGYSAGNYNQKYASIALGSLAGQTNQSTGGIAIGWHSAYVNQGQSAIALGNQAGQNNSGTLSMALGDTAGQIFQREYAISVGYQAGQYNQGIQAVAIGSYQAGQINQGNQAVAVGSNAGNNYQGSEAVALGFNAGAINQGYQAVALGYAAGQINQRIQAMALGYGAGYFNQGTLGVAIGYNAGDDNQGAEAVAIGYQAGKKSQGTSAVAIGYQAGQTNQGIQAVAIGSDAGQQNQGAQGVAIGTNAGKYSQGQNSVAIGFQAGQTNQASNSIVLNAGGSALTAGNTGTFINPIRQTTINGAKLMAYDYSSTNEIIDVSSLSIDTYGNLIILGNATLQTNYIQPTGNTLAIGTGTANVINIGNIGNLSPAYSNIINIGGTYDFVNLGGNVTSTSVNNLVVNNKTITLNAGSITNYSSAGSGLLIRDNSDNTAGYFEVDLSMNGFVFKAPNINQSLVTDGSINNVVDLNVNSLKTSLNSAILMLQPSGTLHSDSSYVINVSNIDISNIFLRSSTSSTLTNQVVTTDVTVSGNIQAISFNATSDYRIKGNIQLLDNHFSVDTLRPIHYYNELAKREDIGFLAHEVQEHYPYLVSGEKDGQDYQALNYSGIIGILVKDVQECKAEIKRLKEKISQCIVK